VQAIAVTVTSVNEAPVITSNGGGASGSTSINENTTAVTTVTATDADSSDTLIYSISGGADQALFSINSSTGALTFASAPNYESPTDSGANGVYDVQVTVADDGTGTLTDTQDLAVTVDDVNENPVITSDGGGAAASVDAAENQTAVTTVTATDEDTADTLTYSISGGADQALFSINSSTGVLTFASAPNYESPGDSGANNVYDVQVTATDDGTGTLTDVQAIAVTVTSVNEAPVISSNGGGASGSTSINENTTAVTTVAATDADSSDTLTYSISGGADQAKFSINSSTGALTFASAPDYENPTDSGTDNVYDVQVTVTDDGSGTLTDVQALAITVNDVNENPVITSDGGGANASVNAAENQTSVTTVTASNEDTADTLTYSISGGADQALFSINSSTGVLTFASAPNYENPTDSGTNNVYDVQVTVTDDGTGTLTDVQDIAVTVTNANEAPVITSNGGGASGSTNVNENTTAVTTVTATDVDSSDTLTYSISGGADQGKFSINSSTGALTFASAPDYESPTDSGADNVYDVQVTVADDGSGTLTDVQALAITVSDVNENPVITSDGGGASASVNAVENQTSVTTVTATNEDTADTLTYSISGGADQALFSINSSTGVLTFSNAPNYESPTDSGANNVYDVQVTVTDDGTGTLTDVQDIAVTVTNVNENPAFTGTPAISGSAAVGNTLSLTGTGTSDVDGDAITTSFQWKVGGTDIAGAVAATYVLTSGEAHKDITCTLTLSDGQGGTASATTAAVSMANIAPTFTGAPAISGTPAVGNTLSLSDAGTNDEDGDAITTSYQWKAGGVDISGATAATHLLTSAQAHKDITCALSISDGQGGTASATTAAVSMANTAPTISGSPATSVDEDSAYAFTPASSDVDGDSLTFGIVNKPGWANFNTATGALTGTPANDNVGSTTGIVITVGDGLGGSASLAAFDLAVVNTNDAPTISGTPLTSVEEDSAYSFTPTASDDDAGDTATFSITNKPAWASFDAATGALTGTPTNTDVGATTGIVITVADAAGAEASLPAFDLAVVNTNDAPVIAQGAQVAVSMDEDGAPTAWSAPTLSASDDDGDEITWSLASEPGHGSAVASGSGSSPSVFTYAPSANWNGEEHFTVKAADGNGGEAQVEIVVTVAPQNDPPSFAQEAFQFEVAENTVEGSVVGSLSASDPDAAATLNFTIISGNGSGLFALDSETGALTLAGFADYESASDYSLGVQVSDGELTDASTVNIAITDDGLDPALFADGKGATIAEGATLALDKDNNATMTVSGGSGQIKLSVDQAPDGAGEPEFTIDDQGKATFTPSGQGAFAGTYLLTVSDQITREDIQITVEVPYSVEASSKLILIDGPVQTLTVRGAQAGTNFSFLVLDPEASTLPQPFPADEEVPATLSDAAAQDLFEDGNPAQTVIVPGDVDLITPFVAEVQEHLAEDDLQSVALTETLRIIPSVIYSGTVLDSDGAPLAGAAISTKYLKNDEGEPWSATTGENGFFSLSAPQRMEGSYVLVVSHDDYLPVELSGAQLETVQEIALQLPAAVLKGTLEGLVKDTIVTIQAAYEDGFGKLQHISPVKVVATGSGADAFTLNLEARKYKHIIFEAPGYLSKLEDNAGTGFDLSEGGAFELAEPATLERTPVYGAQQTTSTDENVPSHVTFGGEIYKEESAAYEEIDLSQYIAVATDLAGIQTPLNSAPNQADAADLDVDLPSEEETRVSLVDPTSGLIVHTVTYQPEGKVENRPNGVQQLNPKASAEAVFEKEAPEEPGEPEAVLTRIAVEVPADGLDLDGFTCEPPPATLEVYTLDIDSKDAKALDRTRGTEYRLVEVNLHLGNCDGGLVDMSEDAAEDVLREILITIPFDRSLVEEGWVESGAVAIYHAANRAAFLSGGAKPIPASDIIEVDYVNGWITFRSSHLSVFSVGLGVARSTSAGATDNDRAGCFIMSLGL